MPRVQHSRILDIPFNSIRKYTKISRWGRANFENLRLDRPKFVHEDVTIGPKGGCWRRWPETLRNCASEASRVDRHRGRKHRKVHPPRNEPGAQHKFLPFSPSPPSRCLQRVISWNSKNPVTGASSLSLSLSLCVVRIKYRFEPVKRIHRWRLTHDESNTRRVNSGLLPIFPPPHSFPQPDYTQVGYKLISMAIGYTFGVKFLRSFFFLPLSLLIKFLFRTILERKSLEGSEESKD